jgi:hypothetical protein
MADTTRAAKAASKTPVRLVLISDMEHPAGKTGDMLFRALDHLLDARDISYLILRSAERVPDYAAMIWARKQGVKVIFVHKDWRDGTKEVERQVAAIKTLAPSGGIMWIGEEPSRENLLLADMLAQVNAKMWTPPRSVLAEPKEQPRRAGFEDPDPTSHDDDEPADH